MHCLNVEIYMKACKAREERGRAARKAAKEATKEADGGEDKENNCVGKVVVPTTRQ
jgi:hypothetical protein